MHFSVCTDRTSKEKAQSLSKSTRPEPKSSSNFLAVYRQVLCLFSLLGFSALTLAGFGSKLGSCSLVLDYSWGKCPFGGEGFPAAIAALSSSS